MSDSISMPLKDKVAVITGAGRGIGRAIALAYAKAGACVVCSARGEAEIGETARQITAAGGSAIAHTADVVDYEAVVTLFQRARSASAASTSWWRTPVSPWSNA